MFSLEELKFISETLKGSESQDEMSLSIIAKIDDTVSKASDYKLCLWSFYWDCGRQGDVEGLFKATKEEVEAAIGKEVYFGEILGKHSEVYGTIKEGEISLESDEPLVVMEAMESGYNPLDYLRFECFICGNTCRADEYDVETNMCDYCKEEHSKKENK